MMLKLNFKNILIAIIIIILFCYFHPTKETISCDSNLTCKVNRQYIYLIDTNFKINLSYNSNIFIKPGKIWNIQHRPSRGRLITHYAHLQITDINGRKKQPFTNYYLAYSGKSFETPDKITLYETQYFKKTSILNQII